MSTILVVCVALSFVFGILMSRAFNAYMLVLVSAATLATIIGLALLLGFSALMGSLVAVAVTCIVQLGYIAGAAHGVLKKRGKAHKPA